MNVNISCLTHLLFLAMNDSDHLIELLIQALLFPTQRKDLIRDFQRLISEDQEEEKEGTASEVFGDLAIDLDFYEPDPTKRSEDPSYYGDERLEEEIRAAFNKLHTLGVAIPFDRLSD